MTIGKICNTCGREKLENCDGEGHAHSSGYCFFQCANFKEHEKEVRILKKEKDRKFLDWIDINVTLQHRGRNGVTPRYFVCATGVRGNPEAIVRKQNGDLIFIKKRNFSLPKEVRVSP